MEELQKLINIVRHKGQRSLQLVNQNFRKKEKSKDNVLFEALLNDSFKNENEIAQKLFRVKPGNRNFRNTKAKLKRKLLNNLYFLDYQKSDYTAYQKAKYECLSQIHQIKILILEEASCIAIKKIPSLVKLALEFELYEIALEALLISRNEYSKQGKCTPLNVSENNIKNIKPINEVINQCEDIYFDTLVLITKSVSSCERILDEIPDRVKKIEQKAKSLKSKRLDILAKKLSIGYYNIINEYEGNLKICNYLEKKYFKKNFGNITVDINFREIAFLKLYSLFALNNTEESIEYAEKNSGLFKAGSIEWFSFKEYHFLSLMKREKYHQATKIFRAVRMHKNFHELPESERDRWRIYRAYLLFVNDSKLVKWGFDIENFKEKQPEFNKELQGYNIATIIIQILFYIREGDIKNIDEKIEQIKKYSSLHLDKRHNYRNSIFIRMLEIIPEREYMHKPILDKGSNYLKKLVSTPIPPDLHQELEIIPHEILWEYIMNILRTNKNYLHYRFYHVYEI